MEASLGASATCLEMWVGKTGRVVGRTGNLWVFWTDANAGHVM